MKHSVTIHIIVFLSVMLAGALLVVGSSNLDAHSFWAVALDHLGAALLVVGAFGIVERAITERHLLRSIWAACKLRESIVECGLDDVTMDTTQLAQMEFLVESPVLAIVLNDGAKWISNNFDLLQRRFSSPTHQITELFVANPNGAFIAPLAAKCGDNPSKVIGNIAKAIGEITDSFTKYRIAGKLSIYYLAHFPTQAVFLGESLCAFTLYPTSNKKTRVPIFICRRLESGKCHGLFEFIHADVEECRITGTCVLGDKEHKNVSKSRGEPTGNEVA
jgi:hypothetical protein